MILIDLHARDVMSSLGFNDQVIPWLHFLLQLKVAERLADGRALADLVAVVSPLDNDVAIWTRANLTAEWRANDLKPLVNRLAALEVPPGAIVVVLDVDDVQLVPIDMSAITGEPSVTRPRTALPNLRSIYVDFFAERTHTP